MLFDPKWEKSGNELWRTVLRDAAKLIEKHGLMKHMFGYPGAGFCLHGAINYAGTGTSTLWQLCESRAAAQAHGAVAKYLQAQGAEGVRIYDADEREANRKAWGGDLEGWASTWNNHRDRTKAEVVAALRGAAEFGCEVPVAVAA